MNLKILVENRSCSDLTAIKTKISGVFVVTILPLEKRAMMTWKCANIGYNLYVGIELAIPGFYDFNNS